jgi:hypothetical protein
MVKSARELKLSARRLKANLRADNQERFDCDMHRGSISVEEGNLVLSHDNPWEDHAHSSGSELISPRWNAGTYSGVCTPNSAPMDFQSWAIIGQVLLGTRRPTLLVIFITEYGIGVVCGTLVV